MSTNEQVKWLKAACLLLAAKVEDLEKETGIATSVDTLKTVRKMLEDL